MARPRPLTNMSLATRLSLVALVVTLVSLAITATVGLARGSSLADGVADDRLVTVADSRATALEANTRAIQFEIAALATSPATRDAITELTSAVRELSPGPVPSSMVDDLTEFYLSDVLPELEQVRDSRVGASYLVPDGNSAIYLQNLYTIPSDDGDGARIDPELVLDPGDGSAYSSVHPSVHQTFGQIGATSGFDDLYLIDAETRVVVYSMRKRIEFATSLDVGPHSGSALARLIDAVDADPGGAARLSDFASYVPAVERPTVFLASAVPDDDGTTVGFLAAALSVESFDRIMSGDGSWSGFGDTGEAFLVGADGIMRTTARSFSEGAAEFLAAVSEPGPAELSASDRRRIAETGTTALVVPVDRRLPELAADGPGLVDAVSHLGEDVRTAYRPVGLEGVEWTMVSEVTKRELNAPIEDYARDMLLAVALFVVAVTFVAVRWSDRVVAPIRAIAQRLRNVRLDLGTAPAADAGPAEARVPSRGPLEYEELSQNVDQMLTRLAERQAAIEERQAERISLLRQFLPAAIARRSEESNGEVLDFVRNASVIVLTLDGVGDLVGTRPDQEVRDLLAEIVDEVDAVAADFGLERVKVTGASYYAVCGVSRPVLDHASRTVSFGLAARDAVAELTGSGLTIRGGVATGAVSVGLAARGALVYDVWGETVTRAEGMAAAAPAASILVTDEVRNQLPSSFVMTGEPADGAVVISSRLPDAEVVS